VIISVITGRKWGAKAFPTQVIVAVVMLFIAVYKVDIFEKRRDVSCVEARSRGCLLVVRIGEGYSGIGSDGVDPHGQIDEVT